MYDTTQLDTFRQVQLFIQNMRYTEVQCFLLGTKADLVQERRVEIKEAEDLAAQFDSLIRSASVLIASVALALRRAR